MSKYFIPHVANHPLQQQLHVNLLNISRGVNQKLENFEICEPFTSTPYALCCGHVLMCSFGVSCDRHLSTLGTIKG